MTDDTWSAGADPGVPPPGGASSADARIDAYRLVEKIGEGGMGEVWVAEQEHPVRRRVALKLIKPGMSSPDFLARFESERQALALMDHPAIAKVFAAGTAADGRPYFVMEFVEGEPITTYCDRHRLTLRERLALYVHVCEGVQHAHQKAIIHRDLKPSNILVGTRDGRPEPKIIDFGVAKATTQRLTERTLFTEVGQLIGTPAYMSPEQANLTAEDIDTRTDVYSLGAVLYELLTTEPPFDPRELRRAGFDEMRRQIREVEPPRPSTRASTVTRASTDAASWHPADIAALSGALRGDLDWITMKALEKDRTRRYGSAADLAADIGRYLTDQPIVARPPSAGYRLGKFARRHRVGVTVAAAGILGLVAFAVVTTIQAGRIARERDRANEEADASREVAEFLVDLFEVSDPSEARGRSVTAREILDRAAERIKTELTDRPALQARLMDVIGRVYTNLGLLNSAEPLLDESRATRSRVLGKDALETLEAQIAISWVWTNQGRTAAAESLLVPTIASFRVLLPPDDQRMLTALNNLALLKSLRGKYAEAESIRIDVLDRQRRVLGNDHADVLRSQNNLGLIYSETGRHAQAESTFVPTAQAQTRTLGPDSPETIRTLSNLAIVYINQRRFAEAESLRLLTLAGYERVYGVEHPEYLRAKGSLANIYSQTGRFRDSERVWREIIATRIKVFGEESSIVFRSKSELAALYLTMGDYASAEVLLNETMVASLRAEGPGSMVAARALVTLAMARAARNAPDAEALADSAFRVGGPVLGRESTMTRSIYYNGACYAMRAKNPARALRLLQRFADAGYRSEDMKGDSDLAPLRGDPQFETILAKVSAAPATDP